MTRLLSACLALALVACATPEDANGDGIADGIRTPDSVSTVGPSSPRGTISGLVMNSLYAPLDGAQVTMVLGEGGDSSRTYKTTTNAEGAYTFNDVPGGSTAQLVITKSGYSTARLQGNVPGSTGNFPINDGNGNAGIAVLMELTGELRARVYTAQGAPAAGARAFLEVNPAAFLSFTTAYGSNIGNFTLTGEVDSTGLLSFPGVPNIAELARVNSNATYTVHVGALDTDNDGAFEALGLIQQYTASALFTNPSRTILLPDARVTGPLQVSATNLDSFSQAGSPPYRNAVTATDPITLVFNQPITSVDATRVVKVVDEDCATNVPVTVTQRAPNTLSIAPTTSWTLGKRYNIVVRATGLDSGATTSFIGYFFAIDPAAPRPLSATATFQVRKAAGATMTTAYEPNDTLNVIFDAPITSQAGTAYAYVDADLNNDGTIGGMNGAGELGGPANSGFPIVLNEQLMATDPTMGTFTCKASGYSSRWRVPVTTFPAAGSITNLTRMRVVFPKETQSAATFQTAWGAPVAIDVNGNIAVQ